MTIRLKPMSEVAPRVYLRRVLAATVGSTSTETFGGALITIRDGGTAKNSYIVEEDFFQELIVSNDSGNTDISEYPILTRVADYEGEDVVILQRGKYKKRLNLEFLTYVANDIIESSEIDPADSYLRYSYEWLAAKSGVAAVYSGGNRNEGCWLSDEDLTGIPYSNTTGGPQRNGLLIADNYLAGANHYPIAVGANVTFKKADNTEVTRTVIGVSETGTGAGDLRICALSGTNPAGVKVYPVAGRWLLNAVSDGNNFNTYQQLFGVFVNRNRDASFLHLCHPFNVPRAKESCTIAGIAVTDVMTDMTFDALTPLWRVEEYATLSSLRINPNYGDSGSGILVPVASGLAAASVFSSGIGGPFFDEDFVNACIASARLDAISRGHASTPLQTVTVATDPTL